MKKTTIGHQPEILIDVCLQGDGLWFDGGEVAQLIGHFAELPIKEQDSQQNIITFLEEVFKVRE